MKAIQFYDRVGSEIECEVVGPELVTRGQRARFICRQKCLAFRPEELTIVEAASDWQVYDINICGRSQMTRTGIDEADMIPGEIFAPGVDGIVSFETIQTAMPFWIDVAYVGMADAAPFRLAVRGTAAY